MTIGDKLVELEKEMYSDIIKESSIGELKKRIIDTLIDDEYYFPNDKGISFQKLFFEERFTTIDLSKYEKVLMPYIIDIINNKSKCALVNDILINKGLKGLLFEGYKAFLKKTLNPTLITSISKYIIYSKYDNGLKLDRELEAHIFNRCLDFIRGTVTSNGIKIK